MVARSANAVIIVQSPLFVKGNFDKTYEKYMNVPSNGAGGGVGTAALGAEEVHPPLRQPHPDLPGMETFAVQAIDDVLLRRNADLRRRLHLNELRG